MKNLSFALLAVMAVVFTACEKLVGEGPVRTETRNISNFKGVDLRMNAKVYFTQAPAYSVEVKAQDNILGYLITNVEGGNLVIRLRNDVRLGRHEDIIVNVSGPDLESLRISGSGDIRTPNLIDADNGLEMDISGSGNIEMVDLVAPELDANISGSGDISIETGVVPAEKLKISGSGNINLANVLARQVQTTTSGSGNTRVNASEQLKVTISGSGNVFYKGQPTIDLSVSGSGKLKPL
ncbi:MAG: head GIN domain-containing protein [Chitinophagaceae bacterium]